MLNLAKLFVAIGLVSITWTSASFEVAAGATVSDIFVATGAVMAAHALRQKTHANATGLGVLTIVVALVVAGGTIGALYTNRTFAGLDVLAFTAASGSAILLFRTLPPSGETLDFIMLPLFAGLLFNASYGFFASLEFADRSNGLGVHPNTFGFAGLMLVGLGFATVLGHGSRLFWLAVLAVPVGVACALESGSRAALGGVVLSILIAFCLMLKRESVRTITASVATGTVAILFTYGRVSRTVGYRRVLGDSSAAASDLGRAELRSMSQELIDSSPIFGSGFGDGLAAHSAPLQFWQIAGMPGLFALLALGYLLVARPLRMDFGRRRSQFAPSLAVSTLGPPLSLWMIFSNALWEGEFWIALALVAAGASTPSRLRPSLRSDHHLRPADAAVGA